MRVSRLSTVALGLVAALSLGAVGCADSDTPNGAADNAADRPAARPDANAALAAAATNLGETTVKVDAQLGAAGTITGALDRPNKRATMTMTYAAAGKTMTLETIMIGTDLFLKMDLGGAPPPGVDPGKWTHLDQTKLPANNSFGLRPGEFDPTGSAKFLKAAATAEWVDDHTIKGTIDLTKADGARGLTEENLSKLGAKAKSVPFEATIDDEGRLTRMVMDIPTAGGEPAGKITVNYSDFGAPVSVAEPPADEVVEAPESMYGILST
jgi:hypothetical protein